MKRGEYITKHPDEFTKGLVDHIHAFFEEHGRPECIKEATMIEVNHAILSEYEFMVATQGKISMAGHTPSETMYCSGDALVAFLEAARCNDKIGEDFGMSISPNPYAIVEKKEEKLPGGKASRYQNQTMLHTDSRSRKKPRMNHDNQKPATNGGKRDGNQRNRKPKRED